MAVDRDAIAPPAVTQQFATPSPAAPSEEIPVTAPQADMIESIETAVPASAPISPADTAVAPQGYDSGIDESPEVRDEVTETSAGPVSQADTTGTDIAEPVEAAAVNSTPTGELPAADTTDQAQGEEF